MSLLDGKFICKSCGFIGSEKDPDVCTNPKSKNYMKLMDWGAGEGCRNWVEWRKMYGENQGE